MIVFVLWALFVIFALGSAFALGTWLAWLTSAVIILNVSFLAVSFLATRRRNPWL